MSGLWFGVPLRARLFLFAFCRFRRAPGRLTGGMQMKSLKHDRTIYLIWYFQVESKNMTSASLCYLYIIAIFQYVIQNSKFTRQNTLHIIILEPIPMYTCLHWLRNYMFVKRQFTKYNFYQSRLAQLVEHQNSDLMVVGSNSTVSRTFSFCILSLSTCSWQLDWCHTNEIKHDVNSRYVGAKREWSFERKMATVLVPTFVLHGSLKLCELALRYSVLVNSMRVPFCITNWSIAIVCI